MMLISVLGMSAQKTWNFSDEIWYSGVNDEGKPITTDYTEATTIDGLTLTPASGKKFTVDANSKTVDDVNYIARLKFPGSAAADGGNTVSFDVSGPCTIKIVLQSSNSNEDRTLNLCAGAYDKENPFATMTALGASPSAGTCTYKGEAATIFVGSYSSGINLYAIYVEPLPVYSIVGDFFTTDLLSGWDYDMDMTQSEENENIYTLVVDKFTAEARTYEYKLRTNHKWGGFEIPEDGTNQNWVFGTDMYPAGDYKLTFTANIADKTLELLPEAIEPELNVVENIAAFKTYETEGEFALKLNNVKVTYAASGVKDFYGTEQPYDWAVLEDASGAYVFQDLGLGAAFSTGMTLNGELVLNCSSGWLGAEITASDNTAASIAAIQAEAGTAEPLVLTEENLDSYAADYDWRYVKIENMTAKIVAGDFGDDFFLHSDLTDADYGILDMLGTNVELPADGDVVDMVGYLFNYYGSTYLQPLTLTKKEAAPEVGGVVTFGNNNPGRDFVTDPFVVSNVINFEADLKDGTHLLLSHNSEGNPNGKFWNGNIAGEWTNSAAVDALNESLGTAFVNADFAAGTNLATVDPGPGDAHSLLTLTFANAEKNTLELYTSVTGRNGALDNITVTGLTNVILSYAVGSGDGFVEQPTFSPDALGVTLVKIQGYLGDDKQVTISSTSMAGEASAKNGFQVAAYKITDEELPAVASPIESMAIVGTFPGMSWEPAEGIAMTQDPENDAVWTVTMEGVEVEGQTYEYKATANGTWGVYELPASGNQNFVFGTEGYPAGVYNLTFTANTSEHTLTLVVEPAQASTEFVDIVVTDEVTDGTLFYRTFSCEQPLDFTGVEGIKAYIGKKNILYDYDANVDASEIILTPIEKVPANTGILLKATEAKTYTVGVAVGDVPAVTDNDLLVAAEKTDLFPLIDGYNKGVATLGHEMKAEYDWWTGQTVTVDALGFLVLPVPAEEGVDFLEKGDVYLSLTKDDLSQTSYHSDYVKLTFTDAEIPVVEDIASFVALANETDATLKFAENTVVTFAGESVVAIQDNTGGLVFQGIEFPSAFNAGDVLTGEITGKLNKAELYPLMVATVQTDPSTVAVAGTSELNPPVVTFEEAFSDENIMRLVKLENVKVSVVEGSYSPTITFTDSNGTDLIINDLFDAVTADLYNLTDGCTLKELTGIAYLIPDGSFYVNFYDTNQFQPISFEVAEEETHEYAIVGDLTGGWDNDMVMTQSEEDPNVYTLTVENFEAFAKTYEYKLRADKQWGIFELPAEGNNSYTFEEMGIYTLTFTANIAENTLTLEAEKTGELVPTYSIVGDFFTDGDISGWDNDQDMTQSDVDENIFTLVVEDFAAAAQTYEYKLRANHQWGLFEIPASGNQNFVFGTEEYPEGTYTLTFTFNAADNTLTLDVESNAPATGIRSMNIDWADGNTYNLNGQRIDTPQKGVVIRNGRKVVIK